MVVTPPARSGPDGVPIREFDTVGRGDSAAAVAPFPSHFPVVLASLEAVRPAIQPTSRLDPAQLAEIAAQAQHQTLRQIATEHGVSHETIRRAILRETRHQEWVRIAND